MKVILSAFSCEPDLGSEDAVGWGWVVGLAARCEKVLVVTRTQHKAGIDAWLKRTPLDNVEFLFYRPPGHQLFALLGRFAWVPHYLAWQRGVIARIEEAMQEDHYDVVHHVTVVSMRFSIRLGELGLPFVYGPVAGGDEAPIATWKGMTWRGKVGEGLRMLSNRWIRWSPGVRRTLRQAASIIVVSPETAALVPETIKPRVSEVLAISYDEPLQQRAIPKRTTPRLKLLFAARCLDWKGLHLGLRALSLAVNQGVDLHLSVIGNGPTLNHWKKLAGRLGLLDRISWEEPLPRPEFVARLPRYDLLFFPSLHDSGGLVVLESLANGLPVVCLDAGGPGKLVDSTCGIKATVGNPDQIALDLAEALVTLYRNEELRHRMALNAVERVAKHFLLDRKVDAVMRQYPALVHHKVADLVAS